MRPAGRRIVVLGVPSAAGAARPGIEAAPRAIRGAGLLPALTRAGLDPIDLVDLSLFPCLPDAGHPRSRNVAGVACAVRATTDEMTRALAEGFALVLGGGCSLLAGVVAGVRRHVGRAPGVVLLDAHADLNTPETSPSGLLDGMALALALGRGPSEIVALDEGPWAQPHESVLLGWRELDPEERVALASLRLALAVEEVQRLGAPETAARALALPPATPLVVHLDVDVMDPAVMPAKGDSLPGRGLSPAELGLLLRRLLEDPRALALLVTGFDPALDPDGRAARTLVDLLATALS
jgi:arginase